MGRTPVPVAPSPKLQAYVMASPSGSEEALPSRLMAVPSLPEYGPPATAVGGWLVAGGALWHAVVPESVAVCPATGTNCHVYEPALSVSFSTP